MVTEKVMKKLSILNERAIAFNPEEIDQESGIVSFRGQDAKVDRREQRV
jgi:hypothetical protein